MKANVKLGYAELEIMMVIWGHNSSITSVQIRDKLVQARPWSMPQAMTSLARLVDKGFISCDRSTGINTYQALISESDYKAQESRSFLAKLYGSSVPNMVNYLYSNRIISQSDIEELRTLLNTLDREAEQ